MVTNETETGAGAKALAQTNGNAKGLRLADFTGAIKITREWDAAPGIVFTFELRLYLSNEMAARREGTIALSPEDRNASLTDWKIRVISDVLVKPPEGFADFPIDGAGSLAERAYAYLSMRGDNGSYKLYWLVQDIFDEYWEKARPRAYLPSATDTSKGSQ
jgi:hypothetical protein